MPNTLTKFARAWTEWRRFQATPWGDETLVVYSEGSHDWPHIGPMLMEFLRITSRERVAYLSSSASDPGLSIRHERYRPFLIDSESVRTVFFRLLRCKTMLMTMPDLDAYHIKRSAARDVHYIYCFHSINSVHAAYREHAFEAYDSILCVGPHHVAELRREEALKNLPARRLLEHGSVKLDTLIADYLPYRGCPNNPTPIILLAPSWGPGSFANKAGILHEMVNAILGKGWLCKLRLHPMTVRHEPALLNKLNHAFAEAVAQGRFAIETEMVDNRSFKIADIMVSDWSGAATEFAFALERPVLFIDTEQKIHNPGWAAYGLPCVEAAIRQEIGSVLPPPDIERRFVPELLRLMNNQAAIRERIIQARHRHIFNIGQSAHAGAVHLRDILVSTT